jgi:Nucleotidyltransferase domain
MSDPILQCLAQNLAQVDGLTALVLGGSRARGTAHPSSDYDLGLYYEAGAPLDVEALRTAITPLVDDPSRTVLTDVGGWGPWINGGGWLSISGCKVDLLYRDLMRVRAVIAECRAGQVSMNYQPGHPHGFCSAIWMGEAALCSPLLDPTGAVADLKGRTWPFPTALKDALIARFQWEVLFSIENAEIAVARGEQTHIAGCAYRALCCIAQVLFAVNARYLINEKGALAEAETFPFTIQGAAWTASEIWIAIGSRDFGSALHLLRKMAADLEIAVADSRRK